MIDAEAARQDVVAEVDAHHVPVRREDRRGVRAVDGRAVAAVLVVLRVEHRASEAGARIVGVRRGARHRVVAKPRVVVHVLHEERADGDGIARGTVDPACDAVDHVDPGTVRQRRETEGRRTGEAVEAKRHGESARQGLPLAVWRAHLERERPGHLEAPDGGHDAAARVERDQRAVAERVVARDGGVRRRDHPQRDPLGHTHRGAMHPQVHLGARDPGRGQRVRRVLDSVGGERIEGRREQIGPHCGDRTRRAVRVGERARASLAGARPHREGSRGGVDLVEAVRDAARTPVEQRLPRSGGARELDTHDPHAHERERHRGARVDRAARHRRGHGEGAAG